MEISRGDQPWTSALGSRHANLHRADFGWHSSAFAQRAAILATLKSEPAMFSAHLRRALSAFANRAPIFIVQKAVFAVHFAHYWGAEWFGVRFTFADFTSEFILFKPILAIHSAHAKWTFPAFASITAFIVSLKTMFTVHGTHYQRTDWRFHGTMTKRAPSSVTFLASIRAYQGNRGANWQALAKVTSINISTCTKSSSRAIYHRTGLLRGYLASWYAFTAYQRAVDIFCPWSFCPKTFWAFRTHNKGTWFA